MTLSSRKIYLLAPAGGHEALSAAKAALKAVNIIVYDTELQRVEELLQAAKAAGIDAVIAADPAVIRLAHEFGLPVHLSVQANVSNWEAVAFYAPYVDVVVAARELTCEQLSGLVQNIEDHDIRGPSGELVRVEAFVHGALCIGLSGRCGMSLCEYNTSSNRGNCYQPCRRAYLVKDAETGQEFQIQNQYIMSPKDLCTIAQLPKLLDAGVSVLKIEGRGRSADYVATTTRVYRKALEAWQKGDTPSLEQIADWRKQLLGVFNRRFWEGGYYLGEQADVWAGTPTTGAIEFEVPSMQVLEKPADFAGPGADVCFPLATKVRPNDKIFALKER